MLFEAETNAKKEALQISKNAEENIKNKKNSYRKIDEASDIIVKSIL